MYKEYFGLTHMPFGKESQDLWETPSLLEFKLQFANLLHSPGVGILTGEPGVGKTAAIRSCLHSLNLNQYQVFYLCETHFTSFDIYRQIAFNLGVAESHRYSKLWRDIKSYIANCIDNKHIHPIFIIDEAHNLPHDFLCDFPSFLNFKFDARDMLTVWFVGQHTFTSLLKRNDYSALVSRIRVRCQLHPINDPGQFPKLIEHAFKMAGCNAKLLSDSGIEIIRIASQGKLRNIYNILIMSMQLAQQQNLNHLPDDLITTAISKIKG